VPFIEQLENDLLILKKIIFIQQGRIKMTKSEFLKDITKKKLSFKLSSNYVSWAENQHIGMISEGSCNTEDVVMTLEIQLGITGIKYNVILKIENRYFEILIIFHKITVFLIK